MQTYLAVGWMIVAYLLGSLSTAIIVSRLLHRPDPLHYGSKNPGATNVLRVGGKFPALLVLIGDVLKGFIPVWCAYHFSFPILLIGLVAVAACLGHIYPVFFHFRGGKGVATALGAMLAVGWDATLVVIVIWLLVVFISGYSSLGALISALLAPLFVWFFHPQLTLPISMLACLIIWRHYDNIERLWRKQESKIWHRKKRTRR